MRVLVAGWFSFDGMGATAGDLHARDVVSRWLSRAQCPHDIVVAPPFTDGLSWSSIRPSDYTHLVFVCGPFGEDEMTSAFLKRFEHCVKIGVNLSMLTKLEDWNPFDLLLERDSSANAYPDLSLLSSRSLVPIVGLVLVKPQPEYGKRGRHAKASDALRGVLNEREAATVHIDTRLDVNSTGLRTAAEVESLIARMDVVLTTRLHGIVLSLKNGVPALAIDAIAGGAKVRRQAESLGWPACFDIEKLDRKELLQAYDWCLTEEAREKARACAEAARQKLATFERAFVDFMTEARTVTRP